MKLNALLAALPNKEILQTPITTIDEIEQIVFDSRKVAPNTMFVAIKGVQTDGHKYIDMAVEKGATVVVVDQKDITLPKEVMVVCVDNSADALGYLAAAYYDYPSTKLKLVGVTGTNGKTTVATLLYQLFMSLGYKTGLLSTVENKIVNQTYHATHTTGDPLQINRFLAEMVDQGCDYAFMESSSHAIEQSRLAGLDFDGGVFTNISHDHLDYHKTFKNYINAKKKFFDNLGKHAFALVNIDDKRGEVMLQNTKAKKVKYSLKAMADFKAKIVDNSLTGLHLDIDNTEVFCRLIGNFNAYNLLSVYGVAVLLGHDKMEVLQALSNLNGADGRFEYIVDQKTGRIGIIDYAHTPDALENVLNTIHKLKQDKKVFTVVGCGGDRDTAKRPVMAKIAADYSDQLILTSDNPRTEDPFKILADMEAGVPVTAMSKTLVIEDRKTAIKTACRLAKTEGGIILIAGKGHETYQDVMGTKIPFNEKEILAKELEL